MGSRYGGDYRRSGDWGFRDSPPPPRWDTERFSREREERYRGPPVMEKEKVEFERDRYSRAGDRFDDRFFVEERYGPPARRPERRYYEEDEFIERRIPPAGDAIVPYRRPEEPPPRPGILRRQSSLDTFDRRPQRRYVEIDQYRAPAPPPVRIPVPPRRPSPPRYAPRYAERDFEEIKVAEPDYYGDEEYRTYREREWTNRRQRRRSNSSETRIVEEEVIEEKPWPRRGKTKIPRAKVHTRAIIELGYPYEEDGETIILLKALNKQQIDEVITLSSEFRDREIVNTTTTIHLIESPPPREESVHTIPMSEAPRSVREWDTLKVESHREVSPSRSRRSRSTRRRSHSRRGSSPPSEVSIEKIVEKKEIREVSPARTARHSRRGSGSSATFIERKEFVDIEERDESNSIHAGPLALVVPERRRKTDREIKDQIRALEEERRILRIERGSREKEIIIERERPEEIVEVRKDKKASPPDPRLIRALMATLT